MAMISLDIDSLILWHLQDLRAYSRLNSACFRAVTTGQIFRAWPSVDARILRFLIRKGHFAAILLLIISDKLDDYNPIILWACHEAQNRPPSQGRPLWLNMLLISLQRMNYHGIIHKRMVLKTASITGNISILRHWLRSFLINLKQRLACAESTWLFPKSPFNFGEKIHVRKALNMAVNRERIDVVRWWVKTLSQIVPSQSCSNYEYCSIRVIALRREGKHEMANLLDELNMNLSFFANWDFYC